MTSLKLKIYMTKTIMAVMLMLPLAVTGGDDYWQQRVEYEMEIDFDVETHRFDGTQKVEVLQQFTGYTSPAYFIICISMLSSPEV